MHQVKTTTRYTRLKRKNLWGTSRQGHFERHSQRVWWWRTIPSAGGSALWLLEAWIACFELMELLFDVFWNFWVIVNNCHPPMVPMVQWADFAEFVPGGHLHVTDLWSHHYSLPSLCTQDWRVWGRFWCLLATRRWQVSRFGDFCERWTMLAHLHSCTCMMQRFCFHWMWHAVRKATKSRLCERHDNPVDRHGPTIAISVSLVSLGKR